MNNEKIRAAVRISALQKTGFCVRGSRCGWRRRFPAGPTAWRCCSCWALQPEFGYALSACHVNHGLRGAAADRDEAFVRAECARLGVPLRVFHAAELADEVDVPQPHAGEDWARRLRYACFAPAAQRG